MSDLKRVRKVLGKSQSDMSDLLGISTRAVQSYEQGWRPTPAHVQQMAGLLLYLNWRKEGNTAAPCWKARRCPSETRARCPAYQYKAGDLCWLIAAKQRAGAKQPSWKANMANCRKCAVMKDWLPENGYGAKRRV